MASRHALALLGALALALFPQLGFAGGVSVHFDLSNPTASPFPNDAFTVRDWSNRTFRRVNLPKPDCAARPSDCADVDVINTLDGFSTQPRVTVPFTGDIDPATVSSDTVFLVNLGDTLSMHGFGQRVGINQVVWDPATRTLAFESDELLNQHSRYLMVVTDGVRDATGRRIKSGRFAAAVEHLRGSGKEAEFLRDLRDAVRMHAGRRDKVVAATLFTTQSISTDLEKIALHIKLARPSPADFLIGNLTSAAPVRAVFPVSTLSAVVLRQQVGTAPTFAAPLSIQLSVLDEVPGAVAQVAYGQYSSPDYETPDKFIPATGTLSGHPQVQGTNRLVFQLFVPAGAKPAAGWPVAIFNHGGSASIYLGGPWRVASVLASQGIATIAINAVGHAGGPLGTLTVTRVDGPDVVIGAGGRGIDLDGNGSIGASEGSFAAPPRLAIGNRDGLRQTAIDTMQLVRQIEVGIDFDGDAVADLDAARIFVLGQSFGANHGAMMLGIEPNVRAGVLNVGGGSFMETGRLGSVRPAVGSSLAARVPSLINVGGPSGFEFNENIPLRNLAPLTNTVPGAMEIAKSLDTYEWVQQAGNPVAYAPFIRKHPLPGRVAKPVLLQFAKGDQSQPNPTNTALLRAGDLANRATLFRNDLASAADPAVPKDPHRFMTNTTVPSLKAIARAAQRQIATFLASNGTTTIDPDDTGALFEVPIPLPLPETLNFIP